MSGDPLAISAELRKTEDPLSILLHMDWQEVDVVPNEIAGLLVEPATVGIDKPGGILLFQPGGEPHGIELPPSLIKQNVSAKRRNVVEQLGQLGNLPFEAGP